MLLNVRNPSAAAMLDTLLAPYFSPRPSRPQFAVSANHASSMALSVVETDDGYMAAMELPGVPRAAIEVEVDSNVVTVWARADAAGDKDKKESDKMLYSERRTNAYRRSFVLPAEVDVDKSSAKYEDGVLTLTLTRSPAKTSKQLTVH
jgi:HSP20 family protein